MPMRVTGHIGMLAALLLVLTGSAQAQDVRVQATVDATTVGTEERVVYSLEIQGSMNDVRTPSAPEADNLVLEYAQPSTSRSVSIVNGQMSQSLTFRWSYRPRGEGRATIGSTTVQVGNERYATDPIQITVVPQAQRPQQQPSSGHSGWPFGGRQNQQAQPRTIGANDLFIRAVPSKREAYVNEQVIVEYRLYGRDYIQLRQSRLTDSWDAEGFWREELEVDTRPIPQSVVENGLRYNVIVLKRVAAFPTRPGTLTIDPLQIESEVYVPGRSADPFSAFFPSTSFQPVRVQSPPVTINVRPLPAGAPDGFAGAVGQFTFNTRLDRNEVGVGESVLVEMQISGTGNLATLAPPPFEAPGLFEQYDPQITMEIDRSGRAIRGRKLISHVLVPRSNGVIEFPEVAFVYFDPAQNAYRRLSAQLGRLQVTGTAANIAEGATSAGLPVDDIAGLKSGEVRWTRVGRRPLHARALPYVAIMLPLLGVAGAFVYQRRTARLATDLRYARSRRAHPLARKHLREAENLLGRNDPRAFYAEIERALLAFIGNRLDMPETGLTRQQLDSRLRESGVSENVRGDLYALLDEAEQAQFAPVPPDRTVMETAIERASTAIVAISEEQKRRERAEVG